MQRFSRTNIKFPIIGNSYSLGVICTNSNQTSHETDLSNYYVGNITIV